MMSRNPGVIHSSIASLSLAVLADRQQGGMNCSFGIEEAKLNREGCWRTTRDLNVEKGSKRTFALVMVGIKWKARK